MAVAASAVQMTARSRVWFNPDLYSRNYFVPGVIANIIMMVTLMLTALAITLKFRGKSRSGTVCIRITGTAV